LHLRLLRDLTPEVLMDDIAIDRARAKAYNAGAFADW